MDFIGIVLNANSVKLTEEDKKALDNYKYQGGDNGITYKYFHSPLAEMVAKCMPMWLAPNMITLIAAICLVAPHMLIVLLYGQEFLGPVPSWFTAVVGLSHMTYITLDNVDGKQARRTGTSSPLGQMFDHGCDALTFNIAMITVCRLHQMGSQWLTFLFVACGPTGYFMYNLKEFYMGEYYLPIINPISEGCLVGFGMVMYCAYVGWKDLPQPVFYGLGVCEIFACIICITQVYQNIEMIVEILRAKKYEIPCTKSDFIIKLSSYLLLLGL